ncbi:MAG: hypothetical protein H6Q89_2656, partial [Myxococcaceae bacterium]|nr:hypothetical protein [Myxococcaceae bacterium]
MSRSFLILCALFASACATVGPTLGQAPIADGA